MKQIDQFANILTLRKISSLFKITFKEVDELLKVTLETALDVVGCRNASMLMLDDKTKTLQFYQASGQDTEKTEDGAVAAGCRHRRAGGPVGGTDHFQRRGEGRALVPRRQRHDRHRGALAGLFSPDTRWPGAGRRADARLPAPLPPWAGSVVA